MPADKSPKRAFTVRLPADVYAKVQAFIRDHRGKPLYVTPSTFAAEAFVRHLAWLQRRLEQQEDDNHRSARSTSEP